MKITIVTVVFNAPRVCEALDSILAQRLEPGDELELIVIDGASTDGTREVLEGYRSRLAVLVSEPDSGIYHAMNKGLARATGDILGTLNADDLYQDNQVLATVLETFRNNAAKVIYGDLVYVRREDPTKVVRYWKSRDFAPGLFERGWMPPHPTFFVRRELYETHGRFDLSYRLAADFELTMRFLARERVPFIRIPRVLVRMRLGGATNKSLRNILAGNLECQRACRKHGLRIAPWFMISKWLSKLPQFVRRAPHG